MSLFGDLPPPSRGQEEREDSPEAKRVPRPRSSPPPRVPVRSSLKRPAESTAEVPTDTRGAAVPPQAVKQDKKQERRQVRFNTFDEVADEKVIGAIEKIASHISNPSKVPKAAKLATQLLTSGSINSRNSGSFFSILSAAMQIPSQALLPDSAPAYKELFTTCSQHLTELISQEQRAQLEVWMLWAELNNSLSTTDDSFEFARVSSRIQKEVEKLPEATEQEDEAEETLRGSAEEEADKGPAPGEPLDQSESSIGPAALSRWGTGASQTSKDTPSASVTRGADLRQGGEGRGVSGGAFGGQVEGDDGTACGEGQGREEDDPFGLGEMMERQQEEQEEQDDPFGLGEILQRESLPTKKEQRAKKRKEVAASAERAAAEEARLLRERREALVVCLQSAAAKYRNKWAQTAIDILVAHASENKARFTKHQRSAIDALWFSVKEQQQRRKQGRGATGKLDVTAFERLSDMYANDKISIRKGVGDSGGRGTITWLG